MNALVYHAGALGDFIATLPVVAAFRERAAPASVTLIGRPPYAQLAAHEGIVDDVRDIDSREMTPLFTGGTALPERLAAALRGFDTAVVFAEDTSPVLARMRESGIPRIFSQPPFPAEPIHIVDYHLSLLGSETNLPWGAAPRLHPHPSAAAQVRRAADFSPPFAVIHPGSGSARKNWPLQRFSRLSAHLADSGFRTVWLSGPAEKSAEAPVDAQVLRNVSLPALVHVLNASRLYIGNDSGISHLAAAAGCPAVVLFGPSNPRIWAPRGSRVTVVQGRSSCAPCHPGTQTTKACRYECMESITFEKVCGICQAILHTGQFAEKAV
jgi:ADP-heptose:LPS heptosyltransferase